VRALIEAAKQHYRYVVLDVPRVDVMIDALEPSARIVIVANQELATVRAATRISARLRQRYGKERLSVVVSRYDQQAEIGQDDVEKVLGSPVAHTFPSNYRRLEALIPASGARQHNRLSPPTDFAHGLTVADETR
jgi:Flp pilus assembly CpaE family ATPase